MAQPVNYSTLEDLQLLGPVRRGDQDAFLELSTRYLSLLKAKAGSVAGPSAPERDDLLQEGLLGLYLAATTYREDRGASFRTYAGVCVRNRMADAVRRHQGAGNRPLNESLSLDEDQDQALLGAQESPERLLELREQTRSVLDRLDRTLTPLERRVLSLALSDCPRSEIEARSGLPLKTYDNALYRLRQKLRKGP